VASKIKRRTFAENSYLLKEGERTETAFLIMSGKVEIRLSDLSDNPHTLAILSKGDVVGEMSLIDNSPHMASAIAMEKTEVVALSAEEFKKRIDNMDSVTRGILKILVKRIRQMREIIGMKSSETNWSEWENN